MTCMQIEMRQSFCQRFSVSLDREVIFVFAFCFSIECHGNAALFWTGISGSMCQTHLCQLWKCSMSQTLTGILKKPFKGIKLCFTYSWQAWKCLWYLFKFCAFFPQWTLLISSCGEGILQFPLTDTTVGFPLLALGRPEQYCLQESIVCDCWNVIDSICLNTSISSPSKHLWTKNDHVPVCTGSEEQIHLFLQRLLFWHVEWILELCRHLISC